MRNMKNWLSGLFVTATLILTLPTYAWPEVDHMNMCGTATKVVHGGWNGWAQHDRYIAKRGNAYYLRSNCPTTVAPVKKVAKQAYKKQIVTTAKKAKRITRSTKAKSFKRTVKYDEKADCARVDKMNGYGPALTKRYAKRIVKRSTKRQYNYFKK